MQQYLLIRLLTAVPTIFGVTLVVFFIVRLVPGDPVMVMFANQAPPSPAVVHEIRHQLGLDLPIWQQYIQYIGNAVRGNLGTSYLTQRPVTEEITNALPNTLKLATAGLLIAVVLGVLSGVLAATHRGSIIDLLSTSIAVLGVSIPGFWLGLMLILLFAVALGWFPAAGASGWSSLVLPAFTLGLTSSAIIARLTRATMLEVLDQEYIRTARAKGVLRRWIAYHHALRNALIPLVTIIGLQVGGLLSGVFIIEAVFAYPGIGYLGVTALQTRDFPVIQGVVLLVALIFVAVNLVVDLLYTLLDPRIRYD